MKKSALLFLFLCLSIGASVPVSAGSPVDDRFNAVDRWLPKQQTVQPEQPQAQQPQFKEQAPASAISGERHYRVTARNSGKVLDVAGWSTANGGGIIQYSFHGGNNQLWKFVAKGQDYYWIVSKHTDKCLDVSGASTANGGGVIQYDCHGGNNQVWKVSPRGDGYYTIVSKNSGKCLDVSGASAADGAGIIQYDCHNGDNQAWKIE